VTSAPPKFFGKHRGTVVNNVDPLQIGRVQVSVPNVTIIPGSWAMPCFPVTGIQTGVFTVPLVGAGVWVEFEGGDADFPIWTGGFFGSAAEVPAMSRLIPPAVPGFTFQTPLQNGISISDVPGPSGGIMLKTTTGAMILVNDIGITISNGKGATIVLAGPSVTINQGALVVV
jgi:uncharacterized protein involved in type VI secretion and phage assembly